MSGYFVGIGAPKAGTTWLADHLRKCPEVFMPSQKEMHIFDTVFSEEHRQKGQKAQLRKLRVAMDKGRKREVADRAFGFAIRQNLPLYRDFFEWRRRDKPVYGEISPGYLAIGEEGFRAIRDLYPDAKLILQLRNPVDRLWSHVRHHGRRAQKLKEAGERKRAVPDQTRTFQRLLRNPADYTVRRGDYVTALRDLAEVFPPEQCFVMFYEELFGPEGPAKVRELSDFLGIAYRDPALGQPINAAPDKSPLPSELRAKAVTILAPVYHGIAERYGERLPASWRKDMEGIA